MAPLILHNVPDEELYIGDDGVTRPYAMVFPQQEPGVRSRRPALGAEKGSFGKSTRRSRSKTATPARRGDPTIAAADELFESWKKGRAGGGKKGATPESGSPPSSQQNLLPESSEDTTAAPSATRTPHKEPTEVILRGYRSSQQQYAAISHFEQIAGRICEDYSREPPVESRRYKSELRDAAYSRRQALTREERAKVGRADGGEHWVKVTFESAQAADAAVASSPQPILGHLVYAEPYHGLPPARDEAVPDAVTAGEELLASALQQGGGGGGGLSRFGSASSGRGFAARDSPRVAAAAAAAAGRAPLDLSPPQSQSSSRTIDTGTVYTDTTTTASSETVTGLPAVFSNQGIAGALATPTKSNANNNNNNNNNNNSGSNNNKPGAAADDKATFSEIIPTVRKAKLLSADLALLPQPSYTQRLLGKVPLVKWFGGSMIGNEVPRTETGEFDWDRASLYWKLIWWLDSTFGLFGGEILTADKDD